MNKSIQGGEKIALRQRLIVKWLGLMVQSNSTGKQNVGHKNEITIWVSSTYEMGFF